ncbi:MAG: long-chain fatty acid--CoA ligase [Bacteroidetes bacterium]|nr:MAG: long-chain fatty acid--CoA ligase [Bacteroidota bacterium]
MIKQNFVEYFENSIKLNWSLPALTNYQGETFTYGQVGLKIKKFHYLLKKNNIKKGDKVALIGKNNTNWAIVYLATVTYGAVIVPLLQDFPKDDIHHIINHSEAKLLFISDQIYQKIDAKEMNNVETIVSLEDYSVLNSKNKDADINLKEADEYFSKNTLSPANFKLKNIDNKELLGILYTSGTSGFSKGVMLTHNNLAANIHYARHNFKVVQGDRIVSFLPLAHAFGCAFEFLWPFTKGCHITFLGKIPSPQIIIKAFQEIKPKIILSVPLVLEKVYKNKIQPVLKTKKIKFLTKIPILNRIIYKKFLTSLNDSFGGNFREVVLGGAALSKEAEIFFHKIKLHYTIGYGMTECGPLISYSPWNKTKMFSTGRIVDTLELKIDSDDPYNTVGEILVRGENVMVGYYKNEEATAKAIDKDGWLHTGDLGLIDKNECIYIKGRSKSMILGPSGQNIYPEEIEAKINNLPFVNESLVIEKTGKLHALIVPDYDFIEEKGIDSEGLEFEMLHNKNLLNEDLPNYMRIAKFEIRKEEFEKTPKKSIKRFLYTILSNN